MDAEHRRHIVALRNLTYSKMFTASDNRIAIAQLERKISNPVLQGFLVRVRDLLVDSLTTLLWQAEQQEASKLTDPFFRSSRKLNLPLIQYCPKNDSLSNST